MKSNAALISIIAVIAILILVAALYSRPSTTHDESFCSCTLPKEYSFMSQKSRCFSCDADLYNRMTQSCTNDAAAEAASYGKTAGNLGRI